MKVTDLSSHREAALWHARVEAAAETVLHLERQPCLQGEETRSKLGLQHAGCLQDEPMLSCKQLG